MKTINKMLLLAFLAFGFNRGLSAASDVSERARLAQEAANKIRQEQLANLGSETPTAPATELGLLSRAGSAALALPGVMRAYDTAKSGVDYAGQGLGWAKTKLGEGAEYAGQGLGWARTKLGEGAGYAGTQLGALHSSVGGGLASGFGSAAGMLGMERTMNEILSSHPRLLDAWNSVTNENKAIIAAFVLATATYFGSKALYGRFAGPGAQAPAGLQGQQNMQGILGVLYRNLFGFGSNLRIANAIQALDSVDTATLSPADGERLTQIRLILEDKKNLMDKDGVLRASPRLLWVQNLKRLITGRNR